MRVTFYKSLDREFELVGIKGRWIHLVLAGAGAAVVLGFIVGSVAGSGAGIVTAVVGVALVFFGSITFQVKIPSRQIDKTLIASKASGWVIRRETLSRILLDDPRYNEVKKELNRLKDSSENK